MKYFFLFLFFLPAFVANAIPVIVAKIPVLQNWNRPLCERIFGRNKTWRGLLFGAISGGIMGVILFWGKDFLIFSSFFWKNFSLSQMIFFGFLLGFGALLGDAIESAVKRFIHIKPGEPLWWWDNVDYILGAILLVYPFLSLSWDEILFLLILAPLLSFIANIFAFFIKIKKVWY